MAARRREALGAEDRVEPGERIGQFAARYPEALTQLAQWVRDGSLRYEETITRGLERAPDAFLGLFTGDNLGKALVHVADPSR